MSLFLGRSEEEHREILANFQKTGDRLVIYHRGAEFVQSDTYEDLRDTR